MIVDLQLFCCGTREICGKIRIILTFSVPSCTLLTQDSMTPNALWRECKEHIENPTALASHRHCKWLFGGLSLCFNPSVSLMSRLNSCVSTGAETGFMP